MDVRHALAVRFEDHAVDHPHQRVVRLLDRRLLVDGRRAAFLLERLQQLAGAGHVEFDGAARIGRNQAPLGRRADLLVGLVQHAVQVEALANHRDHLHLGDEFHLVDGRTPTRRIVERDDEAPVMNRQRHHLQATRDAMADLAQRFGSSRKQLQVDEGVAHFSHQCGLQLGAADHAHAHQGLAQRHAAIELLLRQCGAQLLLRDHAQRYQRLAYAHDRHAALRCDLFQQLLWRDDFGRWHGL
jgi:hypothetical protein